MARILILTIRVHLQFNMAKQLHTNRNAFDTAEYFIAMTAAPSTGYSKKNHKNTHQTRNMM